jgi:hypothetical protein
MPPPPSRLASEPVRNRRVGIAVFVLLLAVQAALVPVIDHRSQDVTRAWRTVPLSGLRDGVRVAQTLDIGYHGLAGIALAATVAPAAAARHLDVRLTGPDGSSAVTRRVTVTIPPGQTTCCQIVFERIPASGRRFQLELTFRGFTPANPLALQMHRVRFRGGLRVNGRALPANLAMDPDGDVDGVPGALRIPLTAFGVVLVGIDLLVALAVHWLLARPAPVR